MKTTFGIFPLLFFLGTLIFWARCNKHLEAPGGVSITSKNRISIESIGIKTIFLDFAKNHIPEKMHPGLAAVKKSSFIGSLEPDPSAPSGTWKNILGGTGIIQYFPSHTGLGSMIDSFNLTQISSYVHYLSSDTYTISLKTKNTSRPADSFIRFTAIDSAVVINGNTNLGFLGLSNDGLITIPDSLILKTSPPTFTFFTNLRPANSPNPSYTFGHIAGYYFLYVTGQLSGTLNLTTPYKQIGSLTFLVKTGYHYNIQVNTTSRIEPISIYFAPYTDQNLSLSLYTTYPFIKTLIGNATAGQIDGGFIVPRFTQLSGIVSDPNGNIYFSDTYNNVIYKRDNKGNTSLFAGSKTSSGFQNGHGNTASFLNPGSMAMDSTGNIYVADMGNHAIRKIDSMGNVSTLAIGGASGNTSNSFYQPESLILGPHGYLYFLDFFYGNIWKVDPMGNTSKLKPNFPLPTIPGIINSTRLFFFFPKNLAVDREGNFYLSQMGNYSLPEEGVIYKIDPLGNISIYAGTGSIGSQDGPGNSASFFNPGNMIFDRSGNLLVADNGNNKIRKIDPNRNVSTLAGNGILGLMDGALSTSNVNPLAMTFDPYGNMFFTDSFQSSLREIYFHY